MKFDLIVHRRAWLAAALAGCTAWLAGCAASPPASVPVPVHPPAPTATRDQRLAALGFRLTDAGWEFTLTGRLLFDSDSDALDPETLAVAQRLGRELSQLGVALLRVEGHTDSIGSQAYNQALSLRRAEAVARAMAEAGLQQAEIQAIGLGKVAPLNDNRTPEQRQQNRRVAVVVPVP